MMKRVNVLRKKMRKQGMDAAIFISLEPIDDPNIYYFTGFRQMRHHSFACYVVTQKKTTLILSSLDYDRSTGKEADDVLEKKGPLSKMLKDELTKNRTVGVMERLLPYGLSKSLGRKKDITGIISEMRSVKDREEIEKIRKACEIANHGLAFLRKNLGQGITEKKLALELEREMVKKGSEGTPFPTVSVSSYRSSEIHAYPPFSDRKIGRGLGYVDFGATYGGYCSDVTLPFSVGKLTEKEKRIVETVERAYDKALEKLRNGVGTAELHNTAERVIKQNGFKFRHTLGHGIGLDTHDFPSLSPDSPKGQDSLRTGMAFTIEPGVYVPGVGGCRLENDFIMKQRGFEVLTKSTFFKI